MWAHSIVSIKAITTQSLCTTKVNFYQVYCVALNNEVNIVTVFIISATTRYWLTYNSRGPACTQNTSEEFFHPIPIFSSGHRRRKSGRRCTGGRARTETWFRKISGFFLSRQTVPTRADRGVMKEALLDPCLSSS